MKKSEVLARVSAVCRTRHFKWKTEQAYLWQIGRFLDFCIAHPAPVPQFALPVRAPVLAIA